MKLFLSYNAINKTFVESVALSLTKNGFNVFYDRESIAAGDLWTRVIQDGIETSDTALVFIGDEGIGAWQNKEVLNIVEKSIKNDCYKVIPVILPGDNKFVNERLPWFLKDYQWVEFKNIKDEHALGKLLEVLRGREKQNPIQVGKNPYKGMESFGVDDAYCFFGRTYDLNLVFLSKLRFHLSVINHNFLAVVADTGIGKSSFIKAGILASLKKGKFAGSEKWRQIIFKPGQNPLSALSSALKQEDMIKNSRQFEEKAKQFDDELLRTIRDQKETLVIYIDQFEEVITQCREEEEREAFLNNIARAVETQKAIILLSLRSDYYTSFGRYNRFKGLLERNNYTLSDINVFDQDETNRILRYIIIQPAKISGVKVDTDLVETLINDIKQVKSVLTILELALYKIWENKKNDDKITIDNYTSVLKNKKIDDIIEVHAKEVFNTVTNNGADKRKADLFKRIFIPNLIEINAYGEDVGRTATKQELLNIPGFEKDEIENIIRELSDENSRLLTIYETENEIKIEVVHEALISDWPLLKRWINERKEVLEDKKRRKNNDVGPNNEKIKLGSSKKLKKAFQLKYNNPDYKNNGRNEIFNKSKLRIYVLIGVSLIVIILIGISSTPYKRWKFVHDIKMSRSLQWMLNEAGGDIDLVKDLTINEDNYQFLVNKIKFFKNLRTIKIVDNWSMKDLSILNGLDSLYYLEIYFNNKNLRSLRGIEKLTSLRSLGIEGNYNLTGLQSVEKLPSLNSLIISRNKILTNLQGIENLTTLKSLEIYKNDNLTSLKSIEKLTSLHSLIISYNDNLPNLQGIEKLTSLESLNIIGNKYLASLQSIENLPSLNSLIISRNKNLPGLQGIENLPTLNSLEISDNDYLYDLQGIKNLPTLNFLEISDNYNLPSLHGIENVPTLNSLEISENDNLLSLQGIEKLTSLQSLSVSGNLSSIKGIEKLTSLQSLSVSGNLSSIKGIEKLTSLQSLSVSGNLSSIKGIEKLTSLHSLKIFYNDNLYDLQGIQNLPSLHSLEISNCEKLTSLQGIQNLPSLHSLEISNCEKLTSLHGIEKLTSLRSLSIGWNDNLTSLQGIEKLASLHSLEISYNFGLRNIQEIKELRSLQNLKIKESHYYLDINALYDLQKLEKLTIDKDLHIDYQRIRKRNPGLKLLIE